LWCSYAKRIKRMIATATTNPPRMNGYQFMMTSSQNPDEQQDDDDKQE
jgi:hypothetical protein